MSVGSAEVVTPPRLAVHNSIDALLDELAGIDGVRGALVSESEGCVGDGVHSGLEQENAAELGACVLRLVETVARDDHGRPLEGGIRDLCISFGHAQLLILPGPGDRHLAVLVELPELAVYLRARLCESWREIEALLAEPTSVVLPDDGFAAAPGPLAGVPVPAAFIDETARHELALAPEELDREPQLESEGVQGSAAVGGSEFDDLDPAILGDPDSEYGGVMRGALGPVLLRTRQAFISLGDEHQAFELAEQFRAEVEDWLLVASASAYSFPLLVDALAAAARLAGDSEGRFSVAVQAIMQDSQLWSGAG